MQKKNEKEETDMNGSHYVSLTTSEQNLLMVSYVEMCHKNNITH
jgi:hypothetical protein